MSELSPEFYKKLLEVSSNVGMKPEHILNVMALESGLNPAAGTNAVGLVQFLPKYLKNYGYMGSGEDFKKEPGEVQLIYVEKLIKSLMKYNGGKPFNSAVAYYVGNFLPVALRLPGVIQQNPNTIICSKDPKEPHLPNISIETEKTYYNSNYGLDTDKDGDITYGDLEAKLNQVAKRPNFISAVNKLKEHTGYQGQMPKSKEQVPQATKSQQSDEVTRYLTQNKGKEQDIFSNLFTSFKLPQVENLLSGFLQQVTASERSNKKLYKKYLPKQDVLIKVESRDPIDGIEYARVLCTALDEELLATAYTHVNDSNIEIECEIYGNEKDCYEAVKQLSDSVAYAFRDATKKIGSINIRTEFDINKKSSYQQISGKIAELNYRKFMFKFS